MKRAAFTMIEIMFVIVMIGILTAIAKPIFESSRDKAIAARCQAVAGTLNRTVGPAMWAIAVTDKE